MCRSFPGFRPAVPAPVWEPRGCSTWLLCGVVRRFRTFLCAAPLLAPRWAFYDDAVLDGPLCEAEQVPPSTGRSRSLPGVLVCVDGLPPEAYASWLSFADEEAFPLADLFGAGKTLPKFLVEIFGRVPSRTRDCTRREQVRSRLRTFLCTGTSCMKTKSHTSLWFLIFRSTELCQSCPWKSWPLSFGRETSLHRVGHGGPRGSLDFEVDSRSCCMVRHWTHVHTSVPFGYFPTFST